MARESSVAVIASAGLALLCTGQGYTGHTVKTVDTSGNLGATWIKAGVPGSAGDGGTIAAASPTQLVIATASAASWLYYSGDGAAQWQTVLTEPDGGQGWADLGFTTASDGVVIHGPASKGFAGQLMLTQDGGLTLFPGWYALIADRRLAAEVTACPPSDTLLEASVSVLTQAERAAFDGCTGLDATPVPLFSRGPSRRAGLCASDPDGGWYVREGDHHEREDDKGKPLRKLAWALEATIATIARPPGAPPAHPNLAIGMALTRPGQDPGGTGARVLASAAARGHKAGWLGYDRAYTQALPGRFHLPARALGYRLVMDYRDDQLGIQANTGGAILVEGTWHCPALPEPLITATAGLRDHLITRELYDQQIAARAYYQLKRKDGPDTDGYQRLSCPAAGHRPGLICPLRQASRSPRDGRPKVLQPPPEPPKICTQAAITIAPDIGARYRQDLPYGSPAWHKTYATLRNTIKGLNGYAKDPAHQALAQPARRRVRGIAAQSIFTALLLIAANIRKIRAWRALTASDQTRITRRARRRRTSLRDYHPDG
jgi:hypothetical protein